MQDDQKTKEDTEQEREICDAIAQELRKDQGVEHGGFEFDGKDNQGSEVACPVQKSSACHEGRGKHLPSTEERPEIAGYLHRQAKEVREQLLHLCPVFKEEGESALPRGRNPLTISQQSKVTPGSSRPEFSCINLSLQLPHCLGAGRVAEFDTNQKRSSGSFVNGTWRSHSEEISSRFFRPLSASFRAGFGQCRELNDRRWHENSLTGLHLSPEGHDNSKHADAGLGITLHEEDEDSSGGMECRFAAKTLSSTLTNFNTLQDIPESLSLASSRETCALPIHSDIQHSHMHCSAQGGEKTPLSVAPPSISCVHSSECDNFEVEMTTGIAANEWNLRNGLSRHRSEEIDAMSQAGGLVTCKDLDMILTQGSDTDEAPIKVKSEGCNALDLLVSAIQVTSGGIFEMGDDAPGPSGMIEAGDGFHSGSEEVCFIHGSSAIVKKRVIRRARSAFKQQGGGNSLQNARTYNIPEGLPFGRKRKRHPDNKPAGKETENDITSQGSGVAQVKHGGPVIRSLRGRSQVLPIKFCDSVLQPWKRRSRKDRKGMFALR